MDMSAGQGAREWRHPWTQRQENEQYIISKLKGQCSFAGRGEIEKFATSCEESAYATASSKIDYIHRIEQCIKTLLQDLNAARTAQNVPDQDSTPQTSNASAGEWQEVYQKIESLRDMYLLDLNNQLEKCTNFLREHESRPLQPGNEQLEIVQYHQNSLKRHVEILQMNNTDIQRWYEILQMNNTDIQKRHVDSLLDLEASIITNVQLELPQSQNSQITSRDNQMNSQMQPTDLQIQLDGAHINASAAVPCNLNVLQDPFDRLINAVEAISRTTLKAAVADMFSVVRMVDGMAGSAPGNGCRAAIGEDLAATTKCCQQARTFLTPNGSSRTKRARHVMVAMPSDAISSLSSLHGPDAFESERTATSSFKRPWNEPNHALIEEIAEINRRLIDTVVEIVDEDVVQTAVAPAVEGGEGIIVKCSYKAVALSPTLKFMLTSAEMCPIQPLILLIPTDYPDSSPINCDKFSVAVSEEYLHFSMKVKSKFNISLRNLSEPLSLSEMARTWDICVRAVVSEFAEQRGGGIFSKKYGCYSKCS